MSVRRALLNPAFDEAQPVLEERRTPLYFAQPHGQRISEYEQVLLHSQPNPDWIPGGIGQGGWSATFPGGRGAWENYFTEARTTDWFVFRDPERRWQRPYVAEKADEWRSLQRLVITATSQRLLGHIDPRWVEVALSGHLGALGLHDYGVFMALAGPIRDCLGDTLRAALVSSALDFLDNAQVIQAEKIYLSRVTPQGRADVAPSKRLWQEDRAWRGARAFVEALWGHTYDHVEIVFALHALHEPLFGRLIRHELFMSGAGRHDDLLTPQILLPSLRAADVAQRWTRELFGRSLLGDPVFGGYNRRLVRYWLERWLPLEAAALRDAAALWEVSPRLGGEGREATLRVIEAWSEDFRRAYDPDFDPGVLLAAVSS